MHRISIWHKAPSKAKYPIYIIEAQAVRNCWRVLYSRPRGGWKWVNYSYCSTRDTSALSVPALLRRQFELGNRIVLEEAASAVEGR